MNISNSSRVMVYNTTETSLNITDLTPGNEYSVTVAGRDGAGRLGDAGEELYIEVKLCKYNHYFTMPAILSI